MKPIAAISAAFLGLVALLHLARLVFSVEVVIGGAAIPAWASVLAVIVPGALAVGLWREARRSP